MSRRVVRVDMQNLRRERIEIKSHRVEDYRLDVYIVKRFPQYSRTLINKLIKDGFIRVNGKAVKPSHKINIGEVIEIDLPSLIEPQMVAEEIPLNIIYEDDEIVVINKPPRMVVHPAAGHWQGTLANALLHHCKFNLPVSNMHRDDIYRPGIVHRIDKNTSGVIVAAKTLQAHDFISKQFRNRTIHKEYVAIVQGQPRFDSEYIQKGIGKDEKVRIRMSTKAKEKKEALTYYEVIERFRGFALLLVIPKTGRTHQIRLHLASYGYPILGDAVYGGKEMLFLSELKGEKKDLNATEPEQPLICRQALHAFRIKFSHPTTKKNVEFEAPLAEDMQLTIDALRKYRAME